MLHKLLYGIFNSPHYTTAKHVMSQLAHSDI